jgi:hypothetical protein
MRFHRERSPAAISPRRGLHSIALPSHRDAIGFGFPFPLGFALIELRSRTLARLLEDTASALSPQHGPVDQGDCEYRDHGDVDHEPKPPAGITVHRCAPVVSREVNAATALPIHAVSDQPPFR